MRISDWSSDVCSSDLIRIRAIPIQSREVQEIGSPIALVQHIEKAGPCRAFIAAPDQGSAVETMLVHPVRDISQRQSAMAVRRGDRSEEHTSELQSLMRISYAVFCLKKKTTTLLRNAYRRTHISTLEI